MNTKQLKKLLILNIPYIILGLAATNLGEAWRLAAGANASKKIQSLVLDGVLQTAFSNPLPSLNPTDLLTGINVILSQSERITMSSRPKIPKYARNKNVLVVGGSGSGKTRFFIKPNLLQMHSSYVVTDPKGWILRIQRKQVIKK